MLARFCSHEFTVAHRDINGILDAVREHIDEQDCKDIE